ncbi:MAG: GntR family transcriptional regulator [Pseudomonadota bacterium]
MTTRKTKTGASRGRPALPPPDLEPLDTDSGLPTDRLVYNAIRKALMSGAIMPGAKLSSRSIANALGVSAMPVREALKRLDADAVLQSTAKSSFKVREITAQHYEEILAIRLPLEGLLTRHAVAHLTANDIAYLRTLIARMETTQDWKALLRDNYSMRFHIYEKANLPYALSLVENIWLRVGPILHELNLREEHASHSAQRHHYDLVDALEQKNPKLAERALQADILLNAEMLRPRLKQGDQASALSAA